MTSWQEYAEYIPAASPYPLEYIFQPHEIEHLTEEEQQRGKMWLQAAAQQERTEAIVQYVRQRVWPRYRHAYSNKLVSELDSMHHDSSVILTGPTGTGKTFQAWAWWRRWAFYATDNKVPQAQFYTAADLLEKIRKSYDGQRVELVPHQLLVIDDLGVERPTEWVLEQLYRIIDERYRNCLPLFVTTNLSGVQLRDRLGDRLVSRLAEMCVSVRLGGKDRRLGGVA